MSLTLSHQNHVKLIPRASLLYYWIQSHNRTTWNLSRDWTSFQFWTEEFLPHAMSREEIYMALGQLMEFDLITVEESGVTIKRQLDLSNLQFPHSLQPFSWQRVVRSPFFWSGFMVTSVLLLWINALFFSPFSTSLSEQRITPTNPYNVLGEKIDQ
ncbi:MAG: hypothetical protein F6K03_10465 [Kamptonema sp. SIO4C4]|nr:hypothetical protein [Kamptonema sp. SIO4C4]